MAVVVSDTSPIRALHHLGLLDLLPSLFRDVYVPPAVIAELARSDSNLPPVAPDQLVGFTVRAPTDRARILELQQTLDPGESEALGLALELHAAAVIIDEQAGRAAALRLGLIPIGALGILLRGKEAGRIGALAPLIDRLRDEINFYISNQVRSEVLRLASEPD